MGSEFAVGPVVAKPGERTVGFLEIGPMAGGANLRIPIHVVAGNDDGPTLVLLSGQHGDEVTPLSVFNALIHSLDRRAIRGRLVIVPFANPVAFLYGQRSTWIDALYGATTGNLNRLWPGKRDGFFTERIAWTITQHVLPVADAIIDFHSSILDQLWLYYAYYMPDDGDIGRRSREMGRAFGMEILMRRPGAHVGSAGSTLSDYVFRELKIPVLPVEIGEFYGLRVNGAHPAPQDPVRSLPEVGVTGVLNIMKLLGMLPGKPVVPAQQVIVSPETRCLPAAGGILFPEVNRRDIGRVLGGGTVLGRIVSPFTFEVLEEIKTPYARSLLLSARPGIPVAKVNPGDQCFHVADFDTAEWIG